MVNSKENSKHADRSSTTAKWFNPETRWTLLYIGNRGKPITLKRFKTMVLFTLLVICVVIVLAAGLFFWNRNILREKNQLESQLKKLTEQSQELRHERDILLTRLVVAESRALYNQDSLPGNQADEESPQRTKQDTKHSEQSAPFVMTTAEAGDQNQQAKVQPGSTPPPSGLSVAIEEFKLSVKSANNSLKVQFKIKNTSPDSQHVAGHAIVVLKGEDIQQAQWVSLPGLSLVAGKPTGKQQGNAFGISNFKMMRFTASKPPSPDKFQTAAVYVYTQTGELLLEQDFPVNLLR
jgi:cell division protein FtsL